VPKLIISDAKSLSVIFTFLWSSNSNGFCHSAKRLSEFGLQKNHSHIIEVQSPEATAKLDLHWALNSNCHKCITVSLRYYYGTITVNNRNGTVMV